MTPKTRKKISTEIATAAANYRPSGLSLYGSKPHVICATITTITGKEFFGKVIKVEDDIIRMLIAGADRELDVPISVVIDTISTYRLS
jgi:hypothetical protein